MTVRMNALMVARMIKASRTAVVVAIMLLLSSATFHAHAFRDDVTDVINQYVPDAELVGECRVNYLFFKIYDAALFAPAGDWETGKPFALTLSYLRDIPGDVIVARTLTEMRKQGFSDETALGRWREQLSHIIPDVSRETTLTGIADEQGHTVFLTGNEEIGRVQDPAFTEQFFAIWMGANSSRPDLRDQLLGRPG